MDIKKLIRDPAKIHAALEELPDTRLVAKKELKILIPVRFAEQGLASVGTDVVTVGVCVYIVEDKYYGISLVNASMSLDPTSVSKIMIDGDQYYEFYFRAGATVLKTVDLVKVDTVVYHIYDELFSKGRIPWYIDYSDLCRIFDSAGYHAGAKIGANKEVTQLLVSMIGRDQKDRRLYYRRLIKSPADLQKYKPAWVAMRSVIYSATNTTNKLAGSHFKDGLVSALVSPSERSEHVETIMRM